MGWVHTCQRFQPRPAVSGPPPPQRPGAHAEYSDVISWAIPEFYKMSDFENDVREMDAANFTDTAYRECAHKVKESGTFTS